MTGSAGTRHFILSERRIAAISLSFRDGAKHQTSDVPLHIGESRDSGFDASHRSGMTEGARPRSRGAMRPNFAGFIRPQNRAQGMPDAQRVRSRVRSGRKHTR